MEERSWTNYGIVPASGNEKADYAAAAKIAAEAQKDQRHTFTQTKIRRRKDGTFVVKAR
jgi:hypothetical protein